MTIQDAMNADFFKHFSLFVVGVHFTLFIFSIYKIIKGNRNPYLYFYALLNAWYVLLYPFSFEVLSIEHNLKIPVSDHNYTYFLLYTEPTLYYLFFYSFIDFSKSPLLRKTLILGVIYWVILYFLQYVEFQNTNSAFITNLFDDISRPLDLIITIWVFIHLLRHRSPYYQYATYGVSILVVAAFIMAIPNILSFLHVKTPHIFNEKFLFFTMQIAVLCDFFFFLLAIINRDALSDKQLQIARENLLKKEIAYQQSLDNERLRISQDMHDDMGAGISALKLQLELTDKKLQASEPIDSDIKELLASAEDIHRSMREMLFNLKHIDMDVATFYASVCDYAHTFFKKTSIHMHYQQKIQDNSFRLPPTSTQQLLFCIKEALNNVVKHSQATEVRLSVIQRDMHIKVTIKDNGIGFADKVETAGNGLLNMQQRMTNIGGQFVCKSDSSGTVIELKVER